MAATSDPDNTSTDTTLTGVRLHAARLGWLIIAGACLLLLAFIAPHNPRSLWFDELISDSYQILAPIMNYRDYIGYLLFLRYLVVGIYFATALLIFWRKSNDWLALLMSLTLVCLPYGVFFGGVVDSLNLGNLGTPLSRWMANAEGLITMVGMLSIPLNLWVFPNGQIEPPRLAKPVKISFFLLLLVVLVPQTEDNILASALFSVLLAIYILLTSLGVGAQVYRYLRVSTFIQRQQTKWVLFSILINLVWMILIGFSGIPKNFRFDASYLYGLFELHASLVVISLIPVSLAISMLRHHLFDIDLIIRRTLVYSSVTILMALAYFAAVTLLQNLFSLLSGQQTPFAIVLSTLFIAALFTPLRRRVQQVIDRRFYRQKYNAEKALAEFAAIARNEVNLGRVAEAMVAMVQETMQPEQVSLWMRLKE